jgi:hypothetical protein
MSLGRNFANKILAKDINKGASKSVKGIFTQKRNKEIACRFYYYFSIKGLQYEWILEQLNKEFYLSELRLAQIIMDCGEDLEKLKSDKADRKYLAAKIPHFNWN